jgi:hypothetical protein
MLTPSHISHCVMNSLDLVLSPVKMCGGLPTSLSVPRIGIGAGGGGPPPGGPLPGGPPPVGPLPGGPLPGDPPPGNLLLGTPLRVDLLLVC